MDKIILSSYNTTDHIKTNLKIFESFGIGYRVFKFINIDFFRKKTQVVYLNWYENLESNIKCAILLKFLLKVFTLRYIQMSNLKCISSFHNKEAHSDIYPFLSEYLFKLVLQSSDIIVLFNKYGLIDLKRYLSDDDIKRKARIVPPVNYIDHYPNEKHDWITQIQRDPRMKILFAGRMNQPYKNVPMIMDIARKLKDKDILFVFSGDAKEYKRNYIKLTEGLTNVITDFRFVPNNEMSHLLEMCDVLIIPYDVETISNSGTARLAFSYARTVICPFIPFFEDIPRELIYTYTYIDSNDHRRKVEGAILKAYNDWLLNKDFLHDKGAKLKKIMDINNSPKVVANKYKQIFKELQLL